MTGRILFWSTTILILSHVVSARALAQHLGQGEDEGVSALRVVLALALCLALAAAGAFALRSRLGTTGFKWRPIRADSRLELLQSLRLSHQIDLSIVRCDDQELLIVASQHGVQIFDHKGCPADTGPSPS